MMPLFKCKYCGRFYRGEPGRCTHDDCPGSGGGVGAAIAIKWWALCPASNDADAFDIPIRAIAQKWVYEGLGEYL
ncbi:hypothetical protein vBKpnPBP5_3 [Klebsiella phage vB_KpnP_Bp5]|uniref:Uncharacterized protein n=1 Tax=Klebsiella phage vB_KpnP_Bp5 TaxID=2593329 RepID=A0A6M2YG07_9CAUD|nr:hypothetical protein vBKpnPBP5_3 [Klebsiella phage vB_KpnP_Bp5]